MSPLILKNFLSESEIDVLIKAEDLCPWKLIGTSDYDGIKPSFWYNNISTLKLEGMFNDRLSKILRVDKSKIITYRIYLNGQAHGQCGFWHTDRELEDVVDDKKFFTLVYWFDKNWKPEYGGHLMIKISETDIMSILPQYNSGVLFDSTLLHMGLEPTTYCKSQRVSLAYKFEVIL